MTKSQDLSAAILLIAAVTTLWLGSNLMLDGLSAAMHDGIQQAASFEGELDRAAAVSAIQLGLRAMAVALALLFVVLVASARW